MGVINPEHGAKLLEVAARRLESRRSWGCRYVLLIADEPRPKLVLGVSHLVDADNMPVLAGRTAPLRPKPTKHGTITYKQRTEKVEEPWVKEFRPDEKT